MLMIDLEKTQLIRYVYYGIVVVYTRGFPTKIKLGDTIFQNIVGLCIIVCINGAL